MSCPQCGGSCFRDDVDIGVGTLHGPHRCEECGWYEGHEADAAIDAQRESQPDWHARTAKKPGPGASTRETKAVMIAKCPVCGTENNSEDHDEDWHFVCKGLCPYRLRWHTRDGLLTLEVVPEDIGEMS